MQSQGAKIGRYSKVGRIETGESTSANASPAQAFVDMQPQYC